MAKKSTKIAVLAIVLLLLLLIPLGWFAGFGRASGGSSKHAGSSHESSRHEVTKLELYQNPTLVAVHLKGSSVFVIRNPTGQNEADFLNWISAANADITSLHIIADSIYARWSDSTEDRDTIQFGIHGTARGTTRPTFAHSNEIHVGIAQKDFERGSFSLLSSADFAKLKLPKPSEEFTVYGNLVFSTHESLSARPRPHKSPGP